ncbi:MAG: hypothetical protein K0Q63_1176 [Paenibacillus sp.]|nr:hypothetical protein [Paenibacillus sp.]
MHRNYSWLAAGLATLAITAAMTWLPGLADDGARGKRDMVVMRPSQTSRLTNVNIVDVLSRLDLREKLGHAEWNGTVLSLELVVSPGKSRPLALFSDVEKLIGLSFRELDNVDRLLIRIAERDSEGRTLLAALDVRRSDAWLSDDLPSLASADPVHDEDWRQRLRLSFTRAWESRFGSVAGFSTKALPAPAIVADDADVAN